MLDEYELVALGKRMGLTLDDMKKMSLVSYINILASGVETEEEATQADIDKYFG